MAVAVRRMFVMLLALLIIASAIGGLASTTSILRVIANVLVIIVSLYGLFGAWNLSGPHLRAFALLLVALWLYIFIYVLVNIIAFHFKLGKIAWELVSLCVIFVGAVVSYDLSRTIFYESIDGPSVKTALI